MSANRWVRDVEAERPAGGLVLPTIPSLEVRYLSDPEAVAAVIPPPLRSPAQPRVHVRIARIDIETPAFEHHEMVGSIAVEAVHGDRSGEYPLMIPIDLEPAVSISRERYGEPKKLAKIDLTRDGDHVSGSMTRGGVTFVEIEGEVVETLPTPDPYRAVQWWFKFLPAVEGNGFDAGPLLVRVEQVRSPESLERLEGKLLTRDLADIPIVDLPIEELESIVYTRRRTTTEYHLDGPVDPEKFLPFAFSRY